MATVNSAGSTFQSGAGRAFFAVGGTGLPLATGDLCLTLRTAAGDPVQGVVDSPRGTAGQNGTEFHSSMIFDGSTPVGSGYVLTCHSLSLGLLGPGVPFTIRAMPVVTATTPQVVVGIGPQTITLTGTNFPTDALAAGSRIWLMQLWQMIDVGNSPVGTPASATSFTAAITFYAGTPDGTYRVLYQPQSGYTHAPGETDSVKGFWGPSIVKGTAAKTAQAVVETLTTPPIHSALMVQSAAEVLRYGKPIAQVAQAVVETLRRGMLVPNVVGMTAANATVVLNNSALRVGTVLQQFHPTIADNIVLSQSPVAGSVVGAGDKVDLLVSEGPAPPAFLFTIDGVDRTHQVRATGSFRIESQLGARTRLDLEVRDYNSTQAAYRPPCGQVVKVIAPPTLFTGEIVSVADAPLGAPGVGTVTHVQAMDDWRLAAKRLVTNTYPLGMTLKAVVSDLVTVYLASYGLSLDPTMLDGPTLTEPFTSEQATIEDTFNRLALLTGWVYRLTPSNVIEWFDIGTKPRGSVFSTANKNILGELTWTQTLGNFINRVVLRYGSGTPLREDSFVGDGVQRSFPLTYLLATAGWITYPAVVVDQQVMDQRAVGAVGMPGNARHGAGVPMPNGLEYYPSDFPALQEYQQTWPNLAYLKPASQDHWPAGWNAGQLPTDTWYWDAPNHAMVHHQIYRSDPAWPGNVTPATTSVGFGPYLALKKEAVGVGFKWHYDAPTNSLVSDYPYAPPNGIAFTFEYNAQYPLMLVVEDAADIAAHGISEALFEAPDIFELSEAQAYAHSLLRKGGQTPRSVVLRTRTTPGYLPGDTVTVDVPERTLPNAPWLVTEVIVTLDVTQTMTTQLTLLEGDQVQSSWIDFWRTTLGGSSSTLGSGSLPAGGGSSTTRSTRTLGEATTGPSAETTPAVVTMNPPHTPGRLVKWAAETNTITDATDEDIPVGGITELQGDVLAGPGTGTLSATLRDSAGLSVIGRPDFVDGPPTDIVAPVGSGFVLRESSGQLVWGPEAGGGGGAGGGTVSAGMLLGRRDYSDGPADEITPVYPLYIMDQQLYSDANVVGPNSATNGAIAIFRDPTGKNLNASLVLTSEFGGGILKPGLLATLQTVLGLHTALGNNLSYDNTNWMRADASKPGGFVYVTNTPTLEWFTAPAGANPATVTRRFLVDGAGNVTIAGTLNSGAIGTGQINAGPIYAGGINGSSLNLSGAAPIFYWMETDAPAGLKNWQIYVEAQVMRFYSLADNLGGLAQLMTLDRSGNLGAIGLFSAGGAIFERARGTAMGEWIQVPYAATNFSTNAGTWSVASGSVTNYSYMLVGRTLFLNFALYNTAISGAPTDLMVRIPGGFASPVQNTNAFQFWDAGSLPASDLRGIMYTQPGNVWVWIHKATGSWPTISNACVFGQIAIAI